MGVTFYGNALHTKYFTTRVNQRTNLPPQNKRVKEN